MPTTVTPTEPAPKLLEPPFVAGTTEAKPAPEADAQPAHWGDGIALRFWALGLLLMLSLLVVEAAANLFRR